MSGRALDGYGTVHPATHNPGDDRHDAEAAAVGGHDLQARLLP
jgi:hypothetical protein